MVNHQEERSSGLGNEGGSTKDSFKRVCKLPSWEFVVEPEENRSIVYVILHGSYYFIF